MMYATSKDKPKKMNAKYVSFNLQFYACSFWDYVPGNFSKYQYSSPKVRASE